MKKIFYTLGATAAIVAPIIAVVSCGSNKQEDKQTNKPVALETPTQTTKTVAWETLTQATSIDRVMSYDEWKTHIISADNHQQSYLDDQAFWLSKKVNGEQVNSLTAKKYTFKLDVPITRTDQFTHETTTTTESSYYAMVFETTTKQYWLSNQPWKDGETTHRNTIHFNSFYPTKVVDKKTGVETKFTSQEDFLEKFVVSQTQEQYNQEQAAKLPVEVKPQGPKLSAPILQQYHEEASKVTPEELTSPLKINGQVVNVEDDGLYMFQKDYKGTFWNGKTLSEGSKVEGMIKVPETPGFLLKNAMMLGDKDSFYMIYDNDDNDGFNPSSIIENIYFNDTSIAGGSISDNVKLGNLKSPYGNYITFEKSENGNTGRLRPYFGSQNNHMTSNDVSVDEAAFKQNILGLKASIEMKYPDSFKRILNYYGVKIDANGNVVENPDIQNHASHAFAPVFSEAPVFTYEKVASNAYKFTYHFDGNSRITAAHLMLHSTKDAAETVKQYGSLTMGDEAEWSSYTGHEEATYVAIKNQYLK